MSALREKFIIKNSYFKKEKTYQQYTLRNQGEKEKSLKLIEEKGKDRSRSKETKAENSVILSSFDK